MQSVINPLQLTGGICRQVDSGRLPVGVVAGRLTVASLAAVDEAASTDNRFRGAVDMVQP